MTDQELLAILAEKTPDELSEAEIDYLRRRLAESAELREALLGQVQMEAYLAAALGRVHFSTEDIVKRADEHRRPQSSGAALYLGIPLVLLAAVGMLFLFREAIWPRRAPEIAEVPQKVLDATKKADASNTDKESEGKDNTPDEPGEPTTPPAADVNDEARSKTQADANGASGENPAKAAPAPPPPPPVPVTPWQQVLAQQENPPAFEEVAFRPFDFERQLPRRTDLLAWFEAAPGHNHRITEVDTQRGKCGQLEGLARLKAPWTPDSALRLALENYNRLQLHFYSGSVGVTLVYYEDLQFRWVAYTTRRQPGKARPQTVAVTASDDDRARRTELRAGGAIDIRHRGNELIVSRGNIVLLAAPLPAPPDDVYFDGRVAFQGIELVRTVGDPQPFPSSPILLETTRPAELAWTSTKPEIAHAELQADGSVRLAADKAKERVECFAPLPATGLCEVIVELDEVTPGSSVYLGSDQGAVSEVVRFIHDRRTKQLVATVRRSDDAHEEQFDEFKDRPTALIGSHVYVRMLSCGDRLRWALSSDGVHWALPETAVVGEIPNRRTLGLQVVANQADTHLTIKRIVLRELAGLSALAARDLRERAFAFPEARSLGQWLTDVAPLQPPDVDAAAWRRACAIRTLAAGAHYDLANALLELLLDDAAARNLPVTEQLAALNDAMLLATDLRDGGAMRVGLTTRYAQLGQQAWEREGLPPWTTIQWAAMSVPAVLPQQHNLSVEENLRWELIDAVTRRTPAETAELCRRLRFFQLHQKVPLLEWAEALARREAPDAPAATVSRLKDGWRPLLVEEVSKETYNAMNDVRSVVESEAWDDAAQMITSLAADSAAGVAPWPADKDLLVSLPVAVQMMLKNHPPLRETVESNFAPLARLRIARAIGAGDAAAVELATMQFAGTEPAAEAHRWLADQALASGWFARAIGEYERASQLAPALAGELAPRIRLAAAMLGRDAGEPATQSVRLGEMSLSQEQFEALVAEMRSRPGAPLAASSEGQPLQIPPPAGLQAQVKSRLDGNVGDKPQEEVVRRTNQFRVPWVDRQIATALEGDMLYVSNRFQVTAYNLANGQRMWQSPPPPGPMKPAQDWAMIAMRPLVTPQHIFVRQLYGPSPQLVCLNKLDGKIVWTTMLSEREFLVSDPLLVQGQLVELSIELAQGQEGVLRWNQFDPSTGQLLQQRDLVRLRNTWGAHACCEVASLDDSLVAALGGATVAVDAAGHVRWIRKQAMLPGEEEPRWILQRYQPPLVDGDRVYVAQPGVRAVEAIDARTGTRHWQAVLPDLLAVSGLVDGRLIVWTENDLRALDAASGKLLWRHPATDLHSFQLCSAKHVLYGRREPMAGNTASIQTRFVWLDPATGQEQGSALVPQLNDADPRLGPLVIYKDRLVSFFGKGQHDPTRDVMEIWPKGAPEPPQTALTADELWLRHLPPELAGASAAAFSKWQLLSGQIGDRTGILPEAHGERDLLGVRTNPQWPIAFARAIEIPAGAKPRLQLRVGNDAGHDWKIEVRFGDRIVQTIDVTEQAYPDRWKNLEVDLSSLAGQSGTLVVCGRFVKGGENQTVTFWKTLEVVL